jgi:hypothetical protein
VKAHLADGPRVEDFSEQSAYKSSDPDIASIDESGLLHARQVGETAIVVRAAGQVASATVGVIGAPLVPYPATERVNFIDDYVYDKLHRFRIPPSPRASDTEFLRRVCLDLAGTLPPPDRVRVPGQPRPRKREKLIDTLIGSPEFIDYWTFRFEASSACRFFPTASSRNGAACTTSGCARISRPISRTTK